MGAILVSVGIFGGGSAAAWYFIARSKRYTNPTRFGLAVIGIVLWFVWVIVINKIMPLNFERQMLRQMPDWIFSVGIWMFSALFSGACGFLIPRSEDDPL